MKRGVLSIDKEGVRHMIVDDGMSLFIDGIRIECKENPLSALARILHEQQLVLLDWQMLTCNSMLSASEALLYIKETGLEVADGKGNLYRYQDGVIFKGKDIAGKFRKVNTYPSQPCCCSLHSTPNRSCQTGNWV